MTMTWDAEADVVIIGAGASGLPAAIAAADAGASVIVVESHFDIGGRAIQSGGVVHLGGGHSRQQQNGIEDSADLIFEDWTRPDHVRSRRADRDIVRAWADENAATLEFLLENGVLFDEGMGEPFSAGTVPRRNAPLEWPEPSEVVVRGMGGSGLMRPLEVSARQKGVTIFLQYSMTSIIRENPISGRVIGITAVEVDRWFAPTTLSTVNIRANKGVIVSTGGSSGDVEFRRIFDPRLTEEYTASGAQLVRRAADGERAAMAVGASLWGTSSHTINDDHSIFRHSLLGAQGVYSGAGFPPDSPVFFRARATGLQVNDWQDLILVKDHGQRFADETIEMETSEAYSNAVLAWTGNPAKLNGGGPIWAIFDADAVTREKWDVTPPSVDPGGYFFSGNTLEELAANIVNPHQWRPMPGDALRETVERYNSFVHSGRDDDFGKPRPQYKIETPPFYAAWNTPVLHDTYAGLRINGSAQVMDMNGKVIPSLYAAGDSTGGFAFHGLGRATVMGRIAGMHASSQSAA